MSSNNLGDIQLAAPYQKGSGVISVSNLTTILANLDMVPSRVTLYSKGNLGINTTYLIGSIGGAQIALTSVISGVDQNYLPGDLVLLQVSLVDGTGGGGGGSGTVTSITFGAGLSGGTITTSGTAGVANGTIDTLAGFSHTGVFGSVTVSTGLSLSGGVLTATGGGGTVTSASVVTANGFAGTVDTDTTTPAITLTTSVTGILKGNGTAISAATPGTDYLVTLPNPSSSTLGGVQSAAAVSHQWITSISTSGVPVLAQPAFTDISGTATVPQGGTNLATLTAHAVLVGAGTGSVAFATVGTSGRPLIDQGGSADPAFLSTGVKIDSHFGVITTDTVSAGAVTCNLATSDKHNITLVNGTPTTISLSNATTGQVFRIKLIQDGTGSATVVWFTTIKWAGGSAPTLTTTASRYDVFVFECTGSNTYDGNVVGQNYN